MLIKLSSTFKGSELLLKQISSSVKDKQLSQTVLMTLIALSVLNEKFSDSEDEWQLIAKKAKNYLRTQGLNNKQISTFCTDISS